MALTPLMVVGSYEGVLRRGFMVVELRTETASRGAKLAGAGFLGKVGRRDGAAGSSGAEGRRKGLTCGAHM
jgi:hypothetical protein